MSVSNEFLLGAGGYYRADDNSGPYFVGSDGKAIPLAGEPGGGSDPDALKKENNLSDLTDPQAAIANLGLPTEAKGWNLLGFAEDDSGKIQSIKFNLYHWMGAYPANPTTPMDVVPCTYMSSTQRINSYKRMSPEALANALALRDTSGRMAVAEANDDSQVPTFGQVKGLFPQGSEHQVAAFDSSGAMKAVSFGLPLWTGQNIPSDVANKEVAPVTQYSPSGDDSLNSYREVTASPVGGSLVMRDANGRFQAAAGIADDDVVNVKQMNDAIAAAGSGRSAVDTPDIQVSDPADATLLQQNFDDLVNALKAAGVFK